MGKDLEISKKIQNYIQELSKYLHAVQKEIITYNESLGDIKKMQISITQAYFFQFFIKTNNIKNILFLNLQ